MSKPAMAMDSARMHGASARQMQVMHPLVASIAFSRLLPLLLLLLGNQNVSSYTHNPRVTHDNDYNNAHAGRYRNLAMTHGIHAGNKYFATFDEFAKSEEFVNQGSRCRTRDPTNEDEEISDAAFRKWVDNHPCYNDSERRRNSKCAGNLRFEPAEVTPAKIRVYFHILRRDDGWGGFITRNQLEDSISVLNQAFRPHFEFWFDINEDVDYTNNSDWYYVPRQDHEQKMASELKKGSGICNSDLNVYFVNPANGDLGWAYFPWDCKTSPDGVFVMEATVPKGTATGYNLGHTLVHETGHWLGLYHTFRGGCGSHGDHVSDTPDQAYATKGCPVGKDTCPGAGNDPIDNFMDYSNDPCMERFTDGQFTRMIAHYSEFRDPNRFDETKLDDDDEDDECNRHNDKASCKNDSSRCCRWIQDTQCKKRSNCNKNNTNACKKYTKRKQCNKKRQSKCCQWINKTCIKKSKCKSEEMVNSEKH